MEGRPGTLLAFGPNPASVTLHNPVYGGQSDSGPFEIVSRGQALKGLE
jgi:hypothetical protein